MGRTPSQAGRYACSAGKEAERAVVRALRRSGFPQADRRVKTGYRSRQHVTEDLGDIEGTPGICFQVKRYGGTPSDSQIINWLQQTLKQRQAAGADIGVLVIKRHGKADASLWWAYMWCAEFVKLRTGKLDVFILEFPVRVLLADLLSLMRAQGYGDQDDLSEEASA